MTGATLHCFSGKMAAGKSTAARQLARERQALLLEEDHFLATLYPGEIRTLEDYVRCSTRVKEALTDPIVALLRSGMPVVLDFPGNTRNQRAWFRRLFEAAPCAHELHFLDRADEVCKAQLRERSRHLPPGSPFTSAAEFEAITRYFEPPDQAEGFNLVLNVRENAGPCS